MISLTAKFEGVDWKLKLGRGGFQLTSRCYCYISETVQDKA